MKQLRTALGIALRSDALAGELLAQGNAISGDITLHFETTSTRAAATGGWTKVVEITAKDSAGSVHTWLNKAFATSASAGDTSVSGSASVGSATITFVDGVAKVSLIGSNHAWVEDETATLTIANLTILGYTVTGGTHVVTIVE